MPRSLREELLAFVAEQHPFAFELVHAALKKQGDLEEGSLLDLLARGLSDFRLEPLETSPFVDASERLEQAFKTLGEGIRGVFERHRICASIHSDEKIQMLKGMILTRATDNALKHLFLSGEMKFKETPYQ